MAHEHDQLLEAACDWRGVTDEKEAVPFSPETLVAFMNAAIWHRQGVYDSYNRSLTTDAARRGN